MKALDWLLIVGVVLLALELDVSTVTAAVTEFNEARDNLPF